MDIFLQSRIFDWSFDDLKFDIQRSTDKEIDIYIASIGGNVDAGFAIANYIEAVNASKSKTIRTHILSNADSIATVIFLAAEKDNRSIVENSTMFIHQPRFLFIDDVTADSADKAGEFLRIQENRIADYYTKKIQGLTKDEALALMKGEVTLNAEKMKELGIVSEVKESFSIAAIKSKTNNMSLFGKKNDNPLQNVSLKQGDNEVLAIHRGELAENIELERIGEGDALNGEFIAGDKKITVENNKVKTIVPVEAQSTEVDERVQAAINEAVAPVLDLVEALSDKIVALKGTKSTHKPDKGSPSNVKTEDDPQKEAKRNSKQRQAENAKRVAEMRTKHGLT